MLSSLEIVKTIQQEILQNTKNDNKLGRMQCEQRDQISFRSNMTAVHYLSVVTDCLQSQSIEYVSREDNTLNLLQSYVLIQQFRTLRKKEYSKQPEKNNFLQENFNK